MPATRSRSSRRCPSAEGSPSTSWPTSCFACGTCTPSTDEGSRPGCCARPSCPSRWSCPRWRRSASLPRSSAVRSYTRRSTSRRRGPVSATRPECGRALRDGAAGRAAPVEHASPRVAELERRGAGLEDDAQGALAVVPAPGEPLIGAREPITRAAAGARHVLGQPAAGAQPLQVVLVTAEHGPRAAPQCVPERRGVGRVPVHEPRAEAWPVPERDPAVATGGEPALQPAELPRAGAVGGLRVQVEELPPRGLHARPGRLTSALLRPPVRVVAAEAVGPLVVAGRRLRGARQAAVERVVVTPELGRRAVLVDVAQIQEAVGPRTPDRRSQAAGRRERRGNIADGPDDGSLGLARVFRRRAAALWSDRGDDRQQQGEDPHGRTKTPSPTRRSPVGSDGKFTTAPLTVIVVEPPPSRLRASRAPSARITRAASGRVAPALQPGRRPSMVTSRMRPSLRTPARVRGLREATNDPKKPGASSGEKPSAREGTTILPRLSSRGPTPMTSCCSARGISAPSANSPSRTSGRLPGGAASVRNRAASALPDSTSPPGGIAASPPLSSLCTTPERTTASIPPRRLRVDGP